MVVAGALALSLVQLGAPSASAASVPVASAPVAAASKVVVPKLASVLSRPDLKSAVVAARAQGSRVEVESAREVSSSTWANPDGTSTTELHAGPIRFRDSAGAWRDVDLTLAQQADGSVAPKGHPGGLRLAGSSKSASLETPSATRTDVVSADEGAGKTAGVLLGWGGRLGNPTLVENRATYSDVQPGVDMVVEALRSGYEQSFVIRDATALSTLQAAAAKAPVSWAMPVTTRGLTARTESDGSVSFVDGNAVVQSVLKAPSAWDARVDPNSGEHVSTAPVKLSVAQKGTGEAVVTITPDQDWLGDPARVFPLTIDPTYSSGTAMASVDTYVSKLYPTATYSAGTDLKVGTYNDGVDVARSFLTFPLASIKGKDIISASLSLFEDHSWSCTATPFYVYSALGSDTLTNWSNQPAGVASYGSVSVAKGYSASCAAGRVGVPVTDLIGIWAASSSSAGGIRLHASETDNSGWKKFRSMETATDPFISFTYNSLPSTPGTPTHTPGVSSSTLTTLGWTSTTTPTLQATVSDPDGGTVQALFSVYLNGGGTPVIDKAAGSAVASGSASTYVVPAGKLVNGSKYVVRAYGYDGALTSAAWSVGYDYFIVDTTVPNPPVVSSTTWTAGAWTPATSGTITWSDTSPDVTTYSWKLDNGPWSAFSATTSQALSGLAANTQHTFSVKGSDTTGHVSAATDFTFGVGVQCAAVGSRTASQPLTHQLSDSTGMSLNPTNGNLLLTGSLLHLRGVGQDLNIGWRYNALVDTRPTLNTGLTETALTRWADGSFSYPAPDGGCYTFTKNATGWTRAAGLNATMTSPVAGTVKLRFNPSGVVNTYVDTAGVYQLNTSADKNTTNPNLISYTYTAAKLTGVTDTQGRSVTFAYADPNNLTQPSTITDTSLSRTINLAYGGPAGALSTVTDATGAVTTLGYDATSLVSVTNNGNQSTFGYDPTRRLTGWTFGTGSAEASDWSATYNSPTLTTITDGNSNAAKYTISGSQTTHVIDPSEVDITSSWDTFDNLLTRTDTMNNTTSNSYDPLNNMLTEIASPVAGGVLGAAVKRSYPSAPADAQGAFPLGNYQPTGTTDAQGNTSKIDYDVNTFQANSVTSTSKATGAEIGGAKTSTIQGDSAGTNCVAKTGQVCTTTNGNGNTTSYGYDALGNPNRITPPAPLPSRALTYDGAGRVVTAEDGRGNTARYSYDANGRTTQVSYAATGCPAATCVAYTYDDAGNLTSRTSPTGVTSIGYDALNRPTTKTQAGTLTSTATYDGASNLTSYTDTTGTTTYDYNSANRLIKLAEPGGSCPAGVTTPNITACTLFSYDFLTRKTATSFPNGQSTTKVFDTAGRVASITAKTDGGTTVASRAYAYQSATPSGEDQALLASTTDQAGSKTDYGYDGLNRLTNATSAGILSSWAYDNDGNRTSAARAGSPTVYSGYNGADQTCWTSTTSATGCSSPPDGATTYAYDTTGNQTTDQVGDGSALTNSFNVFNQLTDTLIGGSTTQTNTYAATSNTERLTAGATSFINGTLGVTSQTTSGATISYIRDPSGNLIAMHTAGQSYYYTTDQQGSVIALTDSTQALAASYTYDPWGNTTATGALATTNPWTYATGYTDAATGYLKLGARYYNPTTGRFTQPDPSGQEANTYNYAGGDPINNLDPTGLVSGGIIALTIGVAVIGLATGGIGLAAGAGVIGLSEGASIAVAVVAFEDAVAGVALLPCLWESC